MESVARLPMTIINTLDKLEAAVAEDVREQGAHHLLRNDEVKVSYDHWERSLLLRLLKKQVHELSGQHLV